LISELRRPGDSAALRERIFDRAHDDLTSERGGDIPAAALTAYARAELVTVVASLAGRAYKS
jgi:hypothetical protein